MRWWIAVAFVQLTATAARAVEPDRPLARLQVTRIDRAAGLPASGAHALAQSVDGYLWIGTDVGLVRYDGRSFDRLTRAQHPGLPSDFIQDLFAVEDRLWIATGRGLALYHRRPGGGIEDFGRDRGLAGVGILSVDEDRAGRVWVATTDQTFRLDGDRFVQVRDGERSFQAKKVAHTTDGWVWLGGHGLRRWRDARIETFALPLADVYVYALAIASDGALLVLDKTELVAIRDDRAQVVPLPRGIYPSRGLIADDGNTAWTLGATGGISRVHPDGRRETLPGDAPLTAGLRDRDGTIWVATAGRGLLRIREPRVDTLEVPGVARSIAEEPGGRKWIATDAGLVRVDGETVQAANIGLPAGKVSLVHVDAQGRLYAGTPDGLFRWDGATLETLISEPPVVVATPSADTVWVGLDHRQGLRLVEGGMVRVIDGVGSTNAIAVARDGTVWLGTRTGLCRRVDQVLDCFAGVAAAPRGPIMSLLEDDDGNLWVGTLQDGLYRFRDGVFTRLGTEQGLPSDTHYSIVEDDQGRLWSGSDIGVSRLDRSSFAARLFDERDGMRDSDCTGGGLSARDGRIWFPTADGVVVIDPGAPDPRPDDLPALVEEARFGSQTVLQPREVELPRGGAITLRYAAPSLRFGSEVRFRHRLAGVDSDWVAVTEPVATYGNLAPGQHIFAAQARGASGSWGTSATVLLDVPPRFWQTLPFRTAAVAGLAGLIYALHRLRLGVLVRRRLEEANSHLEERVESAVRDLREAERMAAYGQMVAGVAHEVRQPLFALGTAAFVIGDKLKDRTDIGTQVALVQRESRRVNALMDELLEFAGPDARVTTKPTPPAVLLHEAADIFRAEHETEIQVVVEEEPGLPSVPADPVRLVQVLVNLMGNARKHAAGITRIVLRARGEPGTIVLEVENDGAGIAPDALPRIFEPFFGHGKTKGSGLGLAIARKVVLQHGGELSVASRPGGTTFKVELPRG